MKKLKYILLLLSITLTACVSHYQNQLGAIETLLDKGQIDSAKNEIQNIRYTELHNESERALFNLIQTRINCIDGKMPTSDTSLKRAIACFSKEKDYIHLADCYYYKGTIEFQKGNQRPAFLDMKKAEAQAGKTNDLAIKQKICERLLDWNNSCGEYEEALKYGQNNLKYAISANNSNWLAYAYGLLAVTYNGLNKTEKAKACLEKSIPYLHAVPAAQRIDFFDGLAVLYIEKDRSEARKIYELAAKYGQEPLTYYGLGYLEYLEGNRERANAYFQKALHTKEPLLKLDTYDNLINLYCKNGDYKKACDYASERISLKDSLDLQAKKADVSRLQMKFDYDTAQIKLKQRIFYAIYFAVILICIGILVYLLKGIKAYRRKQQILQDQMLIQFYKKRLDDIQNKNITSKDITSSAEDEKQLEKKISEINEKLLEMQHDGKRLYDQIADGGNTVTWGKKEFIRFIEYYKLIDLVLIDHLERDFDNLSPRYQFCIILRCMKKTDKEIEEIMAISPGTIRTIRARIKSKKKA
ncbi:MAG: hypothetical protein LKI18_06980 [Prevotella sp.]|nr:hypothetical protein [Prevotella sp.]